MAPALHALVDGQEHSMSELRTIITDQLALTSDDLRATIPSGDPLFASRLNWAVTYMYQSGLVRRPRRGVVQITPRGQEVLAQHPDRVDISVLGQFEEFIEFRGRSRQPGQTLSVPRATGEATPRETVVGRRAAAGAVVEFDPMPSEEIRTYLARLTDKEPQAVSVILTDGTMLTGQYAVGDLSYPLVLGAFEGNFTHVVAIPAGQIAGILEQDPSGAGPPDVSLLIPPAAAVGLEVQTLPQGFFALISPGGPWKQGKTIHYRNRTMLYLDVAAISARSGGINNVGGGYLVSAQVGWTSKVVGQATRRLRRHVVEIGSQCAAPHADLTLIGYVEFFDVSGVEPSSEGGPLLEVEGSLWHAAVIYSAPQGSRHLDKRWALCYFRKNCWTLGPEDWHRITHPVRVYGDLQPKEQTLDLGVAECQLMVRAAACFPHDK
jgi:hypothetical protein